MASHNVQDLRRLTKWADHTCNPNEVRAGKLDGSLPQFLITGDAACVF